jgi:hypothetical protein
VWEEWGRALSLVLGVGRTASRGEVWWAGRGLLLTVDLAGAGLGWSRPRRRGGIAPGWGSCSFSPTYRGLGWRTREPGESGPVGGKTIEEQQLLHPRCRVTGRDLGDARPSRRPPGGTWREGHCKKTHSGTGLGKTRRAGYHFKSSLDWATYRWATNMARNSGKHHSIGSGPPSARL